MPSLRRKSGFHSPSGFSVLKGEEEEENLLAVPVASSEQREECLGIGSC
jgi:hypothetical protein